jgi:hypothetical protein
VKVREQRQVAAEEAELLLLRLLDLDHHLLRPRISRGRHDLGTGSDVVGVAETCAGPRARLDEHVDAETLELTNSVWGHRHPVLVVLDLLRYADSTNHGCGHRRILGCREPLINGQ